MGSEKHIPPDSSRAHGIWTRSTASEMLFCITQSHHLALRTVRHNTSTLQVNKKWQTTVCDSSHKKERIKSQVPNRNIIQHIQDASASAWLWIRSSRRATWCKSWPPLAHLQSVLKKLIFCTLLYAPYLQSFREYPSWFHVSLLLSSCWCSSKKVWLKVLVKGKHICSGSIVKS